MDRHGEGRSAATDLVCLHRLHGVTREGSFLQGLYEGAEYLLMTTSSHTSTSEHHVKAVQYLWERMREAGFITRDLAMVGHQETFFTRDSGREGR